MARTVVVSLAPGWIIPYTIDPQGDRIAAFQYLDGVIAKSIGWWVGDPADLATERPGWVIYTRLGTKAIRGFCSSCTAYNSVSKSGGYKWHGQSENNHGQHSDHCHEYGHFDCTWEDYTWVSGASWRTAPKAQDSGTTPVTGGAEWAAGVGADHDGPYNSGQDTDNRSPYEVLAGLIRDNNAEAAP